MIYVIWIGVLVYFMYTLRYTIRFAKLDTHFTRKQRVGHFVMIWLIPFLWIGLLKIFLKPKEYIFPKEYKEKGYTIESDGVHLP